MKNVLIIGGGGFIGTNLVHRLLARPEIEIVTIVDPSTKQAKILPEVSPRFRWWMTKVENLDFNDGIYSNYDTVVHLASNADIAAAIHDPTVDFWHGTAITQAVLELCRRGGIRRLLYASGSGVYGEDPAVSFEENHGPCRPISPYGASKLAGEAMISSYCHLFGLSAIAFRFANVVGPYQTHGVGYDFMQRLEGSQYRLRVLGDGTQSKAYIHVDDVLNAVLLANEKHGGGFDVFNVSTMDNLTVRRIAEMAIEERGLVEGSVVLEFAGGDRGWAGDVPRVQLSSAKIRSLGWKHHYSSSAAMRAALKSFR